MSSNNQSQKNLSFAEKLKLYQNGNNQPDTMKNEQKNINKNDLNSQQKIKIQNDIKPQDQSIENPSKNISVQKNQSMNSFQDKIKVFQNDKNDKISNNPNISHEENMENDKNKIQNQQQNINKENENESDKKDQISSSFKEKMKIFQNNNKEISINKNDLKIINSMQSESKECESIAKNQFSSSFQDKMDIFQNDKNYKISCDKNISHEDIIKNDKDKLQNQQQNMNKDTSNEKDKKVQISSSFKDKMKIFQTDNKEISPNDKLKESKPFEKKSIL